MARYVFEAPAVSVNFADTYHRAGIPHPMIVGDPPVVLGFEGVGEIEELGPSVTGFSVGEPARRMTISSAPFS